MMMWKKPTIRWYDRSLEVLACNFSWKHEKQGKAHLVAVVGCGENGDGLSIVLDFITIILALVTATQQQLSMPYASLRASN
jgi:hypothetical protein